MKTFSNYGYGVESDDVHVNMVRFNNSESAMIILKSIAIATFLKINMEGWASGLRLVPALPGPDDELLAGVNEVGDVGVVEDAVVSEPPGEALALRVSLQ